MKKPNQRPPQSDIILYTTPDGKLRVSVLFGNETAWLTQDQIAELFDKGRSTVAEHIQNVFREGELEEHSVCRDFRRGFGDGPEICFSNKPKMKRIDLSQSTLDLFKKK